jgi:glycosyltransferase involved in cell wall biosynthesis
MVVTSEPGAIRLGLVCDYPEEGWPSMDLVGEMILTHLQARPEKDIAAEPICPPYRRLFSRLAPGPGRNVDRALNRHCDYPRRLGRLARAGRFDLFHIVDHSYAQLVHALPPGRAIVTCHDLDAFRCLLSPSHEPRPWWFRALARRVLSGLQKAAAVACDSEATRQALRAYNLVTEDRLHVVPNGVHPACSAQPDRAADAEAAGLLGPVKPGGPPDLLHVGSNIARKRIDVLLDVFAAIRCALPGARLIKVGGRFTAEQDRQANTLGIADAIIFTPFLEPSTLAAIYRRATLTLQPSDAEGFGLPVIESLACGTPVLASDLAVLREVGGTAVSYAPAGDAAAWTKAALALLDECRHQSDAWSARCALGLTHAARYTWAVYVEQLAALYHAVRDRVTENRDAQPLAERGTQTVHRG